MPKIPVIIDNPPSLKSYGETSREKNTVTI
jgi:hypothetical protein